MTCKQHFLAGGIVLFFIGTPIACLLLPLAYAVYLMQGYMVFSLILYFMLSFRKGSSQQSGNEQDQRSI